MTQTTHPHRYFKPVVFTKRCRASSSESRDPGLCGPVDGAAGAPTNNGKREFEQRWPCSGRHADMMQVPVSFGAVLIRSYFFFLLGAVVVRPKNGGDVAFSSPLLVSMQEFGTTPYRRFDLFVRCTYDLHLFGIPDAFVGRDRLCWEGNASLPRVPAVGDFIVCRGDYVARQKSNLRPIFFFFVRLVGSELLRLNFYFNRYQVGPRADT